jgi:hypothetical protein
MRMISFAIALALAPLAAYSQPFYDYLYVTFEGTVTEAQNPADTTGYNFSPIEVGDSFSGYRRIDFGDAPTDSAPENNIGSYIGDASFVFGFSSTGELNDSVKIVDGLMSGSDVFQVVDRHEGIEQFRRPLFSSGSLSVTVDAPGVDFINGDDLLQEFSVSGEDIGRGELEYETDWLDDTFDAISGAFRFALTSFKARPGVCSR